MTGTYLLFRLAGRRFGVRLQGAIEILPWRPLRSVPLSYSYVSGLLDYRDALFPVYDLGRRLGLAKSGSDKDAGGEQQVLRSIILLEEKKMPFGIIADSVVKKTGLEESAASPERLQGIDPRYARGFVHHDYQEALILDFERLFHAG